jgi:hypothetical protein
MISTDTVTFFKNAMHHRLFMKAECKKNLDTDNKETYV